MATDVRISVGDGDVTDDIGLDAGVTGYGIVNGTFSAPYVPGDRFRVISWIEDVRGTTGDDLWTKIRAIQTKLTQAAQAQGAYGHGSRVTLSIKLGDATNYTYADIVTGSIDVTPENFFGPYVDAGVAPFVTVTLVCEPYLRGTAVTTTISGTITATAGTFAVPGGSGSGGLFVADIPGDVPALVRHTIEDVSTSSKIINRLRIGSFSLPDPAAAISQSQYVPWIDEIANGAGTATADATAVGGSCARINLSSTLQRIARYPKPSATFTTGLFDAWVRCRDSNTLLGAPTLTAAGVDNDVNMFVRQALTFETTGATSLSPTWGSATRAGSTLLLGVGIKSRTITITTPSGWTASTAAIAHATGACRVAWFYIENSASRSGVETLTFSSSVAGTCVMYEVVGAIIGSTAVDVEVSGTATGNVVIASGALAQAREMIVAIGQMAVGGTWFSTAINTGFTDINIVYANDTQDFTTGYARSTATTTQNVTIDPSAATDTVGALISVRQAQNLAPAMPVGTYEIGVVAASAGGASLSAHSNTLTVTVTQTDCVLYAEWDVGSGTPDHYRIYYRLGSGTWEYYASAAATGSITAYTMVDDAGTVGDPPTAPPTSLVFLLVALSSGSQTFFTKPVVPTVGNGQWEWLYLGMVPLPPMPAVDGGAPRDWIAYVEASNSAGTGTFDCDALVLAQHPVPSSDNRHFVEAHYKNDDLSSLRRWNVFTRRDGRTAGYLSTAGSDTESGHLIVTGECLAGPGDSWFTVVPDVASSISDVVDCKLTWTIEYTPRYVWMR